MKKILLFSVVLFFATTLIAEAQSLLTTAPQQKNVVLEEYTGIHCQYCPNGHVIAQAAQDDNPGRVVLINIHTGDYASPSAGEPDFRTDFGDGIAAEAGIAGYPAGSVNRHIFAGLSMSSGSAMGRSNWLTAIGLTFVEMSPVNVGMKSEFNAATRELTVTVELYYTDDSPVSSNFINVAFLESGVLGPQTGGGMGNNYEHNHIFRHLLTGQWGDEVTTTTQGASETRTYTYTVPEDFIIENCDVAAFVTEGHQEVYTGIKVIADGGTTMPIANVAFSSSSVSTSSPNTPANFGFTFENILTSAEEYTITLTNNAPDDWASTFTIDGVQYESAATVTFENAAELIGSIDVTPGLTSGFATYELTVVATAYPNAPVIINKVNVMSNVTDLVVHNQGSWSNGSPVDFEADYFAGLDLAENTTHASAAYNLFIEAANLDQLSGVQNIYFNAAWASGLNDECANLLSTFMDNGGNLFVAGQDFGWQIWDNGGTSVTKAFYTDYLHAEYQDDGSPSNNTVFAVSDDVVFGDIGNSGISNIYGAGNTYPDEVVPVGDDAFAIFNYLDNASKPAGVRAETDNYKVVYLGFDPTMVTDADVRSQILQHAHDYFYGEMFATAIVVSQVSGYGECDGEATVNAVYGATGDVTYLWNDDNTQTTQTATGLCAGTYEVTITDASKSSVSVEVTITDPENVSVDDIINNSQITVFPNPSNAVFNVKIESKTLNNVKIEVFNILGNKVYETNESNVTSLNHAIDLSSHSSGIYLVRVKSAEKTTVHKIQLVK